MTISNASELSTNDNLTYYISLRDEQYLVNVAVDRNGEVIESKEYRRGDL